ncbi:family 43 glycosylhydrolase [Paenibacillus doosanensis]|uniref:family 43 glycosylhydrolase n=1 Tax=Paenibacillus doosanensis TaxID=1229154 RepID=UPI00217F6BFB|nr:family 43 glycosylhydrolase [Paenibacillus doosanensis]MCS7458992.1 family 43 glycosylhydrolase [Paenibacillus doosanensis]
MLYNGSLWKDTSGQPLHAHGGGMLQSGPYIYWFGENRQGRKRVSCYRTTDMTNWEFRGDVLTLDSRFLPIDMRTSPELVTDKETGRGANIERPKVIYNAATGKYVMWMHWENGQDYGAARCAIASCDTVDGDYVYHGSFNPSGAMSRDCTLFVDDDGAAYFISAARDNADLHMYRLSDDYLAIDEHVRTLWPGQYREAPALVKRNGVYFMISSGCTGWEPNQGKYAYSRSLTGRWSGLLDFGGPTTYDTQPTFILPLQGEAGTSYWYVGDRWHPGDYHRSSYAILPIRFPDDTTMTLLWSDEVKVNSAEESGDGTGAGASHTELASAGGYVRILNRSRRYLAAEDDSSDALIAETLAYDSTRQHWLLEQTADGYVRIVSKASGRCLEAVRTPDRSMPVELALRPRADGDGQLWQFAAVESGGWSAVISRATGLMLTMGGERSGRLTAAPKHEDGAALRSQSFLITPHYGVSDHT